MFDDVIFFGCCLLHRKVHEALPVGVDLNDFGALWSFWPPRLRAELSQHADAPAFRQPFDCVETSNVLTAAYCDTLHHSWKTMSATRQR